MLVYKLFSAKCETELMSEREMVAYNKMTPCIAAEPAAMCFVSSDAFPLIQMRQVLRVSISRTKGRFHNRCENYLSLSSPRDSLRNWKTPIIRFVTRLTLQHVVHCVLYVVNERFIKQNSRLFICIQYEEIQLGLGSINSTL